MGSTRWRKAQAALALVFMVWQAGALKAWGAAAATQAGESVYDVDRFVLRYAYDRPGQPPLGPVMEIPITLGEAGGVLTAPRTGEPRVGLRLGGAGGNPGREQ